ncbi:MAG: cysteine--tRNA ligase [Ruminococcaceae bacterium]|nr:cysteine--tRNA ligase [Oscillospiraceae bacterium]
MFQPPETDIDLRERSPLALAFVGDGVLELLVRARLVAHSRLPVGALHTEAVEMVSARAQHAMLARLEPLLDEAERNVVRRGRNANKTSVAKNATPEQYRASTGLEALFGWLYLQNRLQRIETLFQAIWEAYLHEKVL